MTNHYHLVIEAPQDNVSRAIQYLNGAYARQFNERHDRSGHLFRGRFRATTLHSREHLEAACDYVVNNPVRAGLVTAREEWRWAGASAVGSGA